MRFARVFPLVAASALALAATGCGSSFKKDAPQTAARDFLSQALSQENGQQACDYMTQDAQLKLTAGRPGAVTCREALERAALISEGEQVDDVALVKDLKYKATRTGNTATVVVRVKGGTPLTLTMKKDEGLGNLYEPTTPWRITGGVEPLVAGAAS